MSKDLVRLYRTKSIRYKYFYNIMPLENIPSVINNGILSFDKTNMFRHASIAMNEIQERRENVRIPNGNRLHSYANLYFTYHNPMMYKRRAQAKTLCVLVIDPAVIYIDGCVLSDRNAAADLARFFTPEVGLDEIDFNLVFSEVWTDPNSYRQQAKKTIKCAEILIPTRGPYDYVVGAYALNKNVEQQLIEMGFDKKIVIDPDVFYW